ncbi:MAG: DUF3307 domain-containing protein [Erysipelotrichaceae bacterium]
MVNYLILVILHLLADFYLQTDKIARCKNAISDYRCIDCKECGENSYLNFKYVVIHSALYAILFVLPFFVANHTDVIKSFFLIFVSHVIIDSITCYINKKSKKTLVFIIDQFIHLMILFCLYKIIDFNPVDEKYFFVVKTIFIMLLLMAPCSVFIDKMFEDLYPGTISKGIFDVGSIIGIMERFLVLIFSYYKSFPSIAMIITVKTWARTNDLKKYNFRNRYLLGTLTSLALALLCYVLFMII